MKEDLRHEEAKLLLLQLINQSQHVTGMTLFDELFLPCLTSTNTFITNLDLIASTNSRLYNINSTMSNGRHHVKERDRKRSVPTNDLSRNDAVISSVENSHNADDMVASIPKRARVADVGPPMTSTSIGTGQNVNAVLASTSFAPKIIYVGSANAMQHSTYPATTISHEQKTVPSAATIKTKAPTSNKRAQKIALRQQLDKLLRQLPKPEPYSQPWKILPNSSNSRFNMLLGLEYIAERVSKTEGNHNVQATSNDSNSFTSTHLVCADCNTDCTCMWNLLNEDDGSVRLLCLECVTKNSTKASLDKYKATLNDIVAKSKEIEKDLTSNEIPTSQTSSSNHVVLATSQATASMAGQDPIMTNAIPILHSSQYQQRVHRPQTDYIYQLPQGAYVPFNTAVAQHFTHPHIASLSTQNFVTAQHDIERRQREHLLNMIQHSVPIEWN